MVSDLLQTDRVTVLLQEQEEPAVPHTPEGVKAEVQTTTIPAESIQARAPVEHHQEAVAVQSTDAVPAVPRAILAAPLPVPYAQHAEAQKATIIHAEAQKATIILAEVPRATIPAQAAEVLQAATIPAPVAEALPAAIVVEADIAVEAAPVIAVEEVPGAGDNTTIKI